MRCPPPNHSAAVTSARSCRGGSVVLYLSIVSLRCHSVDAVHINDNSGRCPLCYPGAVTASRSAEVNDQAVVQRRRRPRGAVRDGLVAAGLELARTGGPDDVVLREATRMVGVVPNAAYRHFADRDELLAAVCAAAMDELGARMAAAVGKVTGERGDPDAAFWRLAAIGQAYLEFAREEPGVFATAYALPDQHAYAVPDGASGRDGSPLGQLRDVLDELVEAGLMDARRREGVEFPVWSTVHG